MIPRWYGSYDTAAECAAAQNWLIKHDKFSPPVHQHIDAASQCFESNDPRLKGK
jgi:hypothetical protein